VLQYLGTPVSVCLLQDLSLDTCPRAMCGTESISCEKGSQSPHYQRLSCWPEDKWKAVQKIDVSNEKQQKVKYCQYYAKDRNPVSSTYEEKIVLLCRFDRSSLVQRYTSEMRYSYSFSIYIDLTWLRLEN